MSVGQRHAWKARRLVAATVFFGAMLAVVAIMGTESGTFEIVIGVVFLLMLCAGSMAVTCLKALEDLEDEWIDESANYRRLSDSLCLRGHRRRGRELSDGGDGSRKDTQDQT